MTGGITLEAVVESIGISTFMNFTSIIAVISALIRSRGNCTLSLIGSKGKHGGITEPGRISNCPGVRDLVTVRNANRSLALA